MTLTHFQGQNEPLPLVFPLKDGHARLFIYGQNVRIWVGLGLVGWVVHNYEHKVYFCAGWMQE